MANDQAVERLAQWGWQSARAGQIEAGVAALAEAAALRPERADILGAWGVALAKGLRRAEAIEALQRSLRLRDDIDLWCVLAEIALDGQRYALALDALKRCVALDPEARHPAGVRARALVRRGAKLLKEASRS